MTKQVVTYEQYCRIMEVKAARAALPSNKGLAKALGLKHKTVENAMHGQQKRHAARWRKEHGA